MESIYGTLMKAMPDGSVEANLAESMTTNDNLVWTLKLTPGLTFTDGTPFDADAVVEHIQNVAAEGSTSVAAADARKITGMEAADDTTVTFTLDSPNNQFNLNFTENSMGMIPSAAAKEAAGDAFATRPVGAGPFMVESFTPGSDIVLVKNPDYKFAADGLPYLDRVNMVTVQDQSSRVSGVLAGDLDAGTAGSMVVLNEGRDQGLIGLEQPVYIAYYLVVNTEDPVLSDVRVRTAISQAIDREAINQTIYQGEHQAMTGMLVPNHPYADSDPGIPGYDLEAAQALMDDYRADTGTDEIPLEIMITPGSEADQMAQLVQQMLGEIGVTVTVAPTDPTAQVGKYLTGAHQAGLIPRGIRAETTTGLRQFFGEGNFLNWSRVVIPEFDRLSAEAASATSDSERLAYLPDLLASVNEVLPMIPIVSAGGGRLVGPAVAGFPDGDSTRSTPEVFDLSRVWAKAE
jgi:peptide/nickel transport system substrate-binding protein